MGLWGIEIGVNLWFQRFRAVPRLLCNYRFRWVLTVWFAGVLASQSHGVWVQVSILSRCWR